MLSLNSLIQKGIEVFINNPHLSEERLYKLFVSQVNANKDEANQIYLFIPVAFCRISLASIKFPEVYYFGEKKYLFSDNKIYDAVLSYAKNNYEKGEIKEGILNILMRSSDFNAINEALHSGVAVQDIEILPLEFDW